MAYSNTSYCDTFEGTMHKQCAYSSVSETSVVLLFSSEHWYNSFALCVLKNVKFFIFHVLKNWLQSCIVFFPRQTALQSSVTGTLSGALNTGVENMFSTSISIVVDH